MNFTLVNRFFHFLMPYLLVIAGIQLFTITAAPIASALTWTNLTGPTGRATDWQQIRTNNDGTVIGVVAAGAGQSGVGDLQLSRDSGSSWTFTSTQGLGYGGLYRLAVSGDGNRVISGEQGYMVRASYSNSVWNFSTRTWSGSNGSGVLNGRCAGYGPNFNSFASSSDGGVWIAGVRDESCIYTSTNSGADWSNLNIGGTNWGSAISSDGTTKVTSNSNGNLYRNSGSGWVAISTTGLPVSGWGLIACDSTCTKMAISTWGGKIYTSSNSGTNWSPGASSNRNTIDLSMSSDGGVIATTDGSDIYISQDLGASWAGQGLSGKPWTGVTVSGDGKRLYAAASDGTIKKTALLTSQTISFSNPSNMTYGDADQTLTVSASSNLSVTLASSTTSVCTVISGKIHIVSAGTCTVTANQSGDATYGPATTVTKSITISKSVSTISITGSTDFIFNGVPQGPSSSTVTGSSGAATYSYSGTGATTYPSSSIKPTNAGSYTVTAVVTSDSNYESATSTSSAFTIAKANLAVVPTNISVAFAGTPTYAKTYSGFFNNDTITSTSFTTGLTPPTCVAASYTTSTSVSSSPLSITCSGGSSTNYTFTYASTANLTITQATPTVSLALSASTPTYGAIDTITATASVPGLMDFKVGGVSISGCGAVSTSISAPYTAQCLWTPGAASTSYSLTGSLSPTNSIDYTSANSATTTTPNSNRAAITVTPTAGQSKAYGANNPTITYSITSGALVGSDTLSGSLTYTGTNVGSYPITIGTLANSNYTITLASVNFGITQATQAAVTLSSLSSSYNANNKTVSLTGSGGSGTGSYTYALDASNTTAGCAVNTATLTYTTAGTCVIAVTRSSDTNYLARTDAVSFTIGLASQTITFGSLSAKSYSSDTFTVSASSSASLTVVFTSGSPTICTTSGTSGSTITLLGVGTCIINANQAGDANTSAASQVSQNFTVNPRAITVTADAKSKSYGASDPTLTYTITTSSLIVGDALTGALSRAAGSDAGTYQIQQGALTSANNPKYAITFVAADLTITRITPTLVLTYPNSNVAILRPGATDTPTVTTSSSSGSLTFATTAVSSICTVDSSTGVISLFGSGSCPVAMTTAQTTNYIQYTETTTVTIALLSTSLTGISQSNLVSMGNPFYAHASIDQSYSFSSGSNGASVAIPAGALDASVPISIHLLADSTDQRTIIGGSGTSVLSVVVSWVASDGSVPNTNTGKAISVTLTNPSIKSGAKIYSIIGNQSTLLGTATADGSVTSLITEDPVLLVINPVVTTPAPSSSSSSSGGGGGYVMAIAVDNSAAIEAANLKLAADKAAAELKAAQEKKTAEEAEAAAIKAAKELADAQAQVAAELKASQDKAAQELRIAEELRLAQIKAEQDLKAAAAKKAAADIAAAARAMKPAVTLYSVSSTLKLSAYDSAYLAKYVKSLKNGAAVTCIGYTYGKNPASQASQTLAKRQANAVCTQMKKTNKTLKTSIVIYPASKAPKAAAGAKWVGVSYRIDGFKASDNL